MNTYNTFYECYLFTYTNNDILREVMSATYKHGQTPVRNIGMDLVGVLALNGMKPSH